MKNRKGLKTGASKMQKGIIFVRQAKKAVAKSLRDKQKLINCGRQEQK